MPQLYRITLHDSIANESRRAIALPRHRIAVCAFITARIGRCFTRRWVKLSKNDIPQGPTGPQYRQGNTLGAKRTHWCRAKFYQQYRLFFRYDLASKILIYAWVNDESTKRAYDSKQDAYVVFRKMLNKGNPPDSWNGLWEAAINDGERIKALLGADNDEP